MMGSGFLLASFSVSSEKVSKVNMLAITSCTCGSTGFCKVILQDSPYMNLYLLAIVFNVAKTSNGQSIKIQYMFVSHITNLIVETLVGSKRSVPVVIANDLRISYCSFR